MVHNSSGTVWVEPPGTDSAAGGRDRGRGQQDMYQAPPNLTNLATEHPTGLAEANGWARSLLLLNLDGLTALLERQPPGEPVLKSQIRPFRWSQQQLANQAVFEVDEDEGCSGEIGDA